MAHTNIGNTIEAGLESVFKANIKDAYIKGFDRFPDEENAREYLGRHRRALLIRLGNEELNVEGKDYFERHYYFTVRAVVQDPDRDQIEIMDLAEEAKYYLQQNINNDPTWQEAVTMNIEYLPGDVETAIKQADLTIRVLYDG